MPKALIIYKSHLASIEYLSVRIPKMKIPRLILTALILFLSGLLMAEETNLESPYSTIQSHIGNLQTKEYHPEQAALTIPGERSLAEKEKLAVKIKQIIDGKGLYIRMNRIPKEPDFVDSLGHATYHLFPEKIPSMYLEKVDENWLYSEETCQKVEKMHKQMYPFGADLLLHLVPNSHHKTFLGLAGWQYLGIALLILFAILLFNIVSWLLRIVVQIITKGHIGRLDLDKTLVKKMARIASLFLVVFAIGLFIPTLQLPIRGSEWTIKTFEIVKSVFVIIFLHYLIDMLIQYLEIITKKTANTLDDQVLPILSYMLKAIVTVIGILHILNSLDVNITALIAGVSIGGLAIALAAQDTVKNLLGSVMIFLDRPFQIGDYIKAAGVQGTVEEVGFRSTRLRSPDTTLITIPNGQLANMVVDNIGMRKYRKHNFVLNIDYSTPPERIKAFVQAIQALIDSHVETKDEGTSVGIKNLSTTSVDLLVSTFYVVESSAKELATKQDIYLEILDIAELFGIQFANLKHDEMTEQAKEALKKDVQVLLKKFLESLESKQIDPEEDSRNQV